jgi:hypothetical protein
MWRKRKSIRREREKERGKKRKSIVMKKFLKQ